MIAKDGVVQAIHYPVFPSHADAAWTLAYLKAVMQRQSLPD
jgi:hypothetical protein